MSPRLFLHVLSLESRTQMSYRANFWINSIANFIADFGVTYFVWYAIFRESGRETIAGYSFDRMVVYTLAVILVGRLVRGREFEGSISQDIYEGGLNRYLVFPISYLVLKYAQKVGQLAPALVQVALFGGVAVLVLDLDLSLSLPGTAMALAAVAVASVLYYLMDYVIHQLAFWADNIWSLDVAKWFIASLLGGWMLPLRVFPDGAREVLEMLPFRFFFDFPARLMLGEIGAAEWAGGMAVALSWCMVFFLLGRFVWWRGRLRYTGVGI